MTRMICAEPFAYWVHQMNSLRHEPTESIGLPLPVCLVWLTVKFAQWSVRAVLRLITRGAGKPTPHAATVMSLAAQRTARRLFDLANEYRVANGRATLEYEDRLVDSAYFHALRMAQTGEFEHTLSDGVELGTRVARAGFRYAVVRENIAFTNDMLASSTRIADSFHQGWVDSPGHRENLLATDVTHLGVAVITWYGLTYAVQNFGAPQAALTGPLWTMRPPRAVLLTNPFGAAR